MNIFSKFRGGNKTNFTSSHIPSLYSELSMDLLIVLYIPKPSKGVKFQPQVCFWWLRGSNFTPLEDSGINKPLLFKINSLTRKTCMKIELKSIKSIQLSLLSYQYNSNWTSRQTVFPLTLTCVISPSAVFVQAPHRRLSVRHFPRWDVLLHEARTKGLSPTVSKIQVQPPFWMSRWKLGSMVSKWVISPTYKWAILGL